jgi:hypothetical protein
MKKAESWEDVPKVVEGREAEANHVVHGISRAISSNELHVDFGDDAPITLATLKFRNRKDAWAAYCKGIRLEVKVVTHPEHEEE